MAKIIKNNFGNFLVVCLIFLMVAGLVMFQKGQQWQVMANTDNVFPESDYAVAWDVTDTSHWDAINDDPASPVFTDKIYSKTNDAIDEFDMTTIGGSYTATSVDMKMYAQGGGTTRGVQMDLIIDGASVCSQQFDVSGGADWFTKTCTGSWDQTQIGGMRIQLMIYRKAGGGPVYCEVAALYAIVTFTPAAVVSVSVTPGTVTYGTLGQNATSSTIDLDATQTVLNDGDVPEDFYIKGTTSTDWTLGDLAVEDVYVHKFCTSTCDAPPTNYTSLTTDYTPIATNVDVNATTSLDLYINTPDPSTVYTQQNVNVIVQAVQAGS